MAAVDAPTLVDVGGRRLALWAAGTGAPTVVLETGLGLAGAAYAGIAHQIAAVTRVVWYDRAGLGQSDPAPTPRTVGDLVQDLRTLLQRARIPGPYVLAGHSLGGLTVRLYRDRYPAEVAALVLIDSAHEEQTWAQMQAELARLSTRSQHIRAAQSGHLIHEDEPKLLVEVICRTVMEIREQRK